MAGRDVCCEIARHMLNSAISEGSFTEFASNDSGQVVGVIVARCFADPLAADAETYAKSSAEAFEGLRRTAAPYCEEYEAMQMLRHDRLPAYRSILGGEVLLLAVGREGEGRGIGTALLNDFIRHVRNAGRTEDIIFCADDLCRLVFFERPGFLKVEEKVTTIHGLGRIGHCIYILDPTKRK